jgi:hypothetical protein
LHSIKRSIYYAALFTQGDRQEVGKEDKKDVNTGKKKLGAVTGSVKAIHQADRMDRKEGARGCLS